MRPITLLLATTWALTSPALHAATAEEAARLKTELMPLGGERAGNKDGSIPPWTGGLQAPAPKPGTRRADPFADDKPLLHIDAKNVDQHATKLSDGVRALIKKYPDSYRLNVYKTVRSAAAPQAVYDLTFKNATRATLVDGAYGPMPKGAAGGPPFPIPKAGAEVMWNALLRYRTESWLFDAPVYQVTRDGKPIMVGRSTVENFSPYYANDGSASGFGSDFYWLTRANTSAPALRAGEAIVGHNNLDDGKTSSWVYLTGQRRVRKLPNPCCDTPAPFAAGLANFDEVEGFSGRLDRFDWKIVGKQELYVPYNTNGLSTPRNPTDVLGPNHINPDHLRWELHRVWVIEATLRAGQRHTSPRTRYYIDEDTWTPVLSDRWDANGQLWRSVFSLPMAVPEAPAVVTVTWGAYELLSGQYLVAGLLNDSKHPFKLLSPRAPDANFSPDAMAGEGVR